MKNPKPGRESAHHLECHGCRSRYRVNRNDGRLKLPVFVCNGCVMGTSWKGKTSRSSLAGERKPERRSGC